MDREASLRLTRKDKASARAAKLDSGDGAVRRDGGL